MNSQKNWKFYLNSIEAWDAMLHAIRNASLSIDIEQYIFQNDSVGKRFIDLLLEKSKAGVKIRIICDEVGSFSFSGSKEAKMLMDAGVKIMFFNPFLPWKPNRETFWYFRDHKKLMIIDGLIGFTGSVCLGDEMKDWRESHVEVTGAVVTQMVIAFDIMWSKQYKKFKYIFKRKKRVLSNSNYVDLPDFEYLTNAPLPKKRFIYYALLRAFRSAKQEILLTTPYFLPNHRLLRAIKQASKRGVIIKLLLPHSTDNLLAHIGAQTYFGDLLKHKVEIYRFNSMIHSKTIVIDGTWSSVGSLNLDNVSLRYNFEGNLISRNKDFSLEVKKQFENDLNSATKLTLADWQRRPLMNKVFEILVWPFRKFL